MGSQEHTEDQLPRHESLKPDGQKQRQCRREPLTLATWGELNIKVFHRAFQ